MKPIDLKAFKEDISGKGYNKLVEYHVNKQSLKDIDKAQRGTILMLPSWFVPELESFIDEWNETGIYSDFWKNDCVVVFDHIAQHATNIADALGKHLDDETLFNIFQVITLNFAYMAHQHKQLRKFAGIKKGLFG